MLGKHLLKIWAKTRSLVALSSGEPEFYAALKASAEGLGMKSVAEGLGTRFTGEVWGDASAALGIIKRTGLGRTRHIDTGLLWIQQAAAEKRLTYHKVLGRDDPADLFTNYLDQATIDKHCGTLTIDFPGGRASFAPTLHQVLSVRSLAEGMADDDIADLNDIRQPASWALNISGVASREGKKETCENDELGLLQPSGGRGFLCS